MDSFDHTHDLQDYPTFFPEATYDLFGEYGDFLDYPIFGFGPGDAPGLPAETRGPIYHQSLSVDQSPWGSGLPPKNGSGSAAPSAQENVVPIPQTSNISDSASLESSATLPFANRYLKSKPEVLDEDDESPAIKRRKWQKHVVIFSTDQNKNVVPRRRKAFAPTRKKEVALNRLIGACVRCKLRKAACDFGLPCQQCLKRVGSTGLGHEICSRQSLMAVRFNNIDLYRSDKAPSFVVYPRVPHTEKNVYVSYPSCCGRSSTFFAVRIQDYQPHPVSEDNTSVLVSWNYREREETIIPDGNSAFISDSLPPLEELLYCRETRHHFCDSGPLSGLHKAFSEFAEDYSNKDRNLPLKGLLKKIIHMKLLLGLYRVCPIMKHTEDSVETEFASWAMQAQIQNLVIKEAVKLEAEALSELERLLYSSQSIGSQNPIAIWVCLWLLLLYYKSHLDFIWSVYGVTDPIYSLGRHLYNAITSIYSALYKTTTPLTFDWRKEEISEMLGRDSELIKSFCNIKTEMFWLHAERDDLLDEDSLFKTLVVENDSKLQESSKKAARQQGIL